MSRPFVKRAYPKKYFSTKAYVVDTQKNHLNKTVILSTQFEHRKHMVKLMDKKIFTIIHSKILLSKPVHMSIYFSRLTLMEDKLFLLNVLPSENKDYYYCYYYFKRSDWSLNSKSSLSIVVRLTTTTTTTTTIKPNLI